MARISIIVPLYNQGHFLGDAIRSLLGQSVTDWEAIIVNDGSTDGSGEMAEKMAREDKRLVVIHQENGGLSAARNTGLDHASGRHIALLDSDDYLFPTYLEKMAAALEESANTDVAWCRVQETDQNLAPKAPFRREGRLKLSEQLGRSLLGATPALRLVWDNPLTPCGQVWRADVVRSLRFNENLRSNEDWDILCRYERRGGKFAFVSEILSLYRRHGSSLNRNERRMIETRIHCGVSNYAAVDDEWVSRLSRLSLSISASPLPPGDALLGMIPGDLEEDLETFEMALESKDTDAIATLWCGGAARAARPYPGTRSEALIQRVRARLLKHPTAWRIACHRIAERFGDLTRKSSPNLNLFPFE